MIVSNGSTGVARNSFVWTGDRDQWGGGPEARDKTLYILSQTRLISIASKPIKIVFAFILEISKEVASG